MDQTSLNMPGFSLTLLLLPEACTSRMLSLIDEPCDAPGWKWSSKCASAPLSASTAAPQPVAAPTKPERPAKLQAADPRAFVRAIARACESLIQAEAEITRMDVVAGDGDCGTTLKVSPGVPFASDGAVSERLRQLTAWRTRSARRSPRLLTRFALSSPSIFL
jgi:hypothetical protein